MAKQHFGTTEAANEEDFFRVMERSKPYKDMERLIKKALLEQWNDLILSGIINSIFTQYKRFFRGTKRKPAKVRKDFQKQDVMSVDELKEVERDTLQQDRFIVSEDALKYAPFLLFLKTEVGKNLKSIGSYYSFKPELRNYLKGISNLVGQSIIDQIPSPNTIKFRLSNKDIKDKINERINELVRQLDATTQKTLVSQLALGVKNGETKTELVERVQQKGKDLSETRSKRIITTETVAIVGYIGYMTGVFNGVTMKTWVTAGDERVCPVCAPLDGVEVPIDSNFEGAGVKYPPAHVMCRCDVYYDTKTNLASNFIKDHNNIHNYIDELFQKAKTYVFYKPTKTKKLKIINPNAVWAGGESLVGKDKNIAAIYEEIRNARPIAKEMLLEQAKDKLTLEGMVQLRSMLGLSPNVKRNK